MQHGDPMNNKLKAKIIENYGKQWVFAREIKVDSSYVSKVVTGAKDLPDREKVRWAKKLNTTTEIFD